LLGGGLKLAAWSHSDQIDDLSKNQMTDFEAKKM
jgi:hypothetical protein